MRSPSDLTMLRKSASESSVPLAFRCFFKSSQNTALSRFSTSLSKNNKISLFSKDRRYGILQEEFFLVYFLQELLATTRYIISRIETDTLLREMEQKARNGQAETVHVSGFWRNLQKNLEILSSTTIREFQDLCKHIQERFQTGNSVFGTLQELQNFY